MELATIFTRQNENALTILEEEGVFRMKPEWIHRKYGDISAHFIKSYDWLSYESAKRVPRPQGVKYPIWCSVDEGYMLREVPGEVVIKLTVPKNQIVYFDSTKWDLILNHMYVPTDADDEKAFYLELKARGVKNPFTLLDDSESRFYPDLVMKIHKSWERLFEISDWNMFTVQANIWEFTPDQIVEIRR